MAIECYHFYFKQVDQSVRMIETDRPWCTVSVAIGIAKVYANGNNIYFEGYVHSGIGSRSVSVSRQAGRQNGIHLNFLKFSSG